MDPFYIIGNKTERLFKIMHITIKEMFYLTKLMTGRPFFGDRLPFDMQSWDMFARLAAMVGIHRGILYEFSFTEPLTLLCETQGFRGTNFENHCFSLTVLCICNDYFR